MHTYARYRKTPIGNVLPYSFPVPPVRCVCGVIGHVLSEYHFQKIVNPVTSRKCEMNVGQRSIRLINVGASRMAELFSGESEERWPFGQWRENAGVVAGLDARRATFG